jgi:hypothetical protein
LYQKKALKIHEKIQVIIDIGRFVRLTVPGQVRGKYMETVFQFRDNITPELTGYGPAMDQYHGGFCFDPVSR